MWGFWVVNWLTTESNYWHIPPYTSSYSYLEGPTVDLRTHNFAVAFHEFSLNTFFYSNARTSLPPPHRHKPWDHSIHVWSLPQAQNADLSTSIAGEEQRADGFLGDEWTRTLFLGNSQGQGDGTCRHSPKFQEYVPKIQNILRSIFQTYEAKQSEDDDSPVDLGYTYILQKGMFASDDGKMQPEWTWEWQPTDYLINT